MTSTNANILISGASVAGPTLAYWLHRYGLHPTVVERTPELRLGLGGHAIDLFGPAVDVVERMGVLPAVRAARTGTELLSFERPGRSPIDVDMSRLVAGITDRHVEIMRGELASILYEATRDHVEYLFGDSIRTLDADGDGVTVTFERGGTRTFGLVVGADGLHSNVRGLAFGAESRFRRYLGGYLGVFTVPNYRALDGQMVGYVAPGKLIAMYPVRQTGAARAAFLFRRTDEFDYDHRDLAQQKRLLKEVFAGDGWEVPRLLTELDAADDFYFDSISQIVMDSWTAGRVALVGDAGYCPGPAVGGGTSVAMVGGYVLAGEIYAAGGDHTAALKAYEDRMREFVVLSRGIGPASMKTLIPRTPAQAWLTPQVMRLLPRLPAGVQQRLSSFLGGPAHALEAITIVDYQQR